MAGEILAQLPEDLRANEAFTGFNTAADIANALLTEKGKVSEFDGKVKDAEGKIGNLEAKLANAIFKPGQDAKPEDIAAYRKAMGVPEKADDYEIPVIEGIENDPATVKWAQDLFHRIGLNKSDAAEIGKSWNEYQKQVYAAIEESSKKARDDAEAAYKKEVGDEKFKVHTELTARLLKENATEEELTFLNESGMGNHPVIIRLITKLAEKTGEDTSISGGHDKGQKDQPGMNYSKSPAPPNN